MPEGIDQIRGEQSREAISADHEFCLNCGTEFTGDPLYVRYRVCPGCRYHYYITARKLVDLMADPNSFHETNESLVPMDPLSFSDDLSYRERVARAQNATGLLEGIITGTTSISGMPAVLAITDFGFMNGSIGSVVGEKIALAAELAYQKRRPLVLIASGGGPRMQEGVLSLMQMPKMVTAIKRLSHRGVPFVSILASPTTGQLYAGAASLADIIFAEPGALMGFAPMRAARQATAVPIPADFQTAAFHLEHGMVDRIVDRQSLKQELGLVLDLLGFKYRITVANPKDKKAKAQPRAAPWDRVQMARHEERPNSRDYVERIFSSFVELKGDRAFGDDPTVLAGLAYLAGDAVVVIGQERGRGEDAARRREGRIFPEGFRKAERMMRLAAKFRLPVITLIDTPGAYQGLEAEERGIGGAIASAMSTLGELRTPVVSLIIGEGGSEAALALGVADRSLMMENAICTAISPEAAAWIAYRDRDRAEEMAASLKLTAEDCKNLGIIDAVVPEPPGGAHTDFDETARTVERIIQQSLLDVQMTFGRQLVRQRYYKYRGIGSYGTYLQAAIATEAVKLKRGFGQSIWQFIARLSGRPVRRQRPRGTETR